MADQLFEIAQQVKEKDMLADLNTLKDLGKQKMLKIKPKLIFQYVSSICKMLLKKNEGLEQQLEQEVEKDDNLNEYEALLQKAEGDIRNHIRSEQQLKVLLESAHLRIEETEKEIAKIKQDHEEYYKNLNKDHQEEKFSTRIQKLNLQDLMSKISNSQIQITTDIYNSSKILNDIKKVKKVKKPVIKNSSSLWTKNDINKIHNVIARFKKKPKIIKKLNKNNWNILKNNIQIISNKSQIFINKNNSKKIKIKCSVNHKNEKEKEIKNVVLNKFLDKVTIKKIKKRGSKSTDISRQNTEDDLTPLSKKQNLQIEQMFSSSKTPQNIKLYKQIKNRSQLYKKCIVKQPSNNKQKIIKFKKNIKPPNKAFQNSQGDFSTLNKTFNNQLINTHKKYILRIEKRSKSVKKPIQRDMISRAYINNSKKHKDYNHKEYQSELFFNSFEKI